MPHVSILFVENEKYYTIHEISALTGLSVKQLQSAINSGNVKNIIHRKKNDTREIIVPLRAMEEYLNSEGVQNINPL